MSSLWDEADSVVALCEQAFMQPRGFDEAKHLIRDAMLKAYIMALRDWAHWKDGEQYVGSCGTTLATAIERAEVDAGKGAKVSP